MSRGGRQVSVAADEHASKPAAQHWTGTWNVLRVVAAGVSPITASGYHCAVIDAGEALAADRVNEAHWRAAKAGKLGYRRGNVAPALAVCVIGLFFIESFPKVYQIGSGDVFFGPPGILHLCKHGFKWFG